MKIMNWKEFCSSLIFRKDNIYIPSLSMSIDKTKFVTKSGYDIATQDSFLKEIYMSLLLMKK